MQMKQITQKQIRRAFKPTFVKKVKMSADIILISTASWLFYHALLPSTAFAQDRKAKAPSEQTQPAQQDAQSRFPVQPTTDADTAALRRANEKYLALQKYRGEQNPPALIPEGWCERINTEKLDTRTAHYIGDCPTNTMVITGVQSADGNGKLVSPHFIYHEGDKNYLFSLKGQH